MRDLTGVRFFFFNDTATTEIYTLSLHDALPISSLAQLRSLPFDRLKIDRAFIAELKEEEHGAKLVEIGRAHV